MISNNLFFKIILFFLYRFKRFGGIKLEMNKSDFSFVCQSCIYISFVRSSKEKRALMPLSAVLGKVCDSNMVRGRDHDYNKGLPVKRCVNSYLLSTCYGNLVECVWLLFLFSRCVLITVPLVALCVLCLYK